MFFSKNTSSTDESKSITESLYKQNLELAVKNKTLSLLGKLYSISLLALEPGELCEKMTKEIQADLSFEVVGVLRFDQATDSLLPLAFSFSERSHSAEIHEHLNLESIAVQEVSRHGFYKDSFASHTFRSTEDLSMIWGSIFSEANIQELKTQGHIKSTVLYPLVVDNQIIGTLILGLNRVYDELISYEKESIESFINVIAVALDKAMLYKELQVTNSKLKAANEGQENLIHIINHQIKGYLAKSRNIFAELQTDDYGSIPEAVKPMIQEGLSSLTEGVGFVQQVLNGSSAENGTLVYAMNPFDFKELVTEVMKGQEGHIRSKDLTSEVTIDDGDYKMKGDSVQLREAIRNLVDNSINYTPAGGLKVRLGHKGENIMLSVEDTGVGIDPEDKPRLFMKGGRGKNSLKININSTGYGLAFVKAVVEAHKGRVWAESEGLGKGSTFYIEIPK